MQSLPVWLEPITLARWPTQPVASGALRYRIAIPQAWDATPRVDNRPTDSEHTYVGAPAVEALSICFMPAAKPDSSLRVWFDALVAAAGRPLPVPALEIWDWTYRGDNAPARERLAVDELHLYEGLGELEERGRPTLARLYGLAARRGARAWKIALSLSSACPPGADEAMIARNDHVRAGAMLGRLELDSESD